MVNGADAAVTSPITRAGTPWRAAMASTASGVGRRDDDACLRLAEEQRARRQRAQAERSTRALVVARAP